MKIKLWAEKNVFGLGWIGTTFENADMTKQGYVEIATVSIECSEDEVLAEIKSQERGKLIETRNKLMKQLEEVEAQL